jgi:hypothetical protein
MAKSGKGFNFLSHGSQDLYPTYLKTGKGFDNHHAIVATIIGNCGAITYVTHSPLSFRAHYNFFPILSTAAAPLPVPHPSTSVGG